MPYTTTELIIYKTLWFIKGYLLGITISMSIIFQDGLIPIPSILGERKRIEKSGCWMLILRFWFPAVECWFFDSDFLAKKCSFHPTPSGELPRLRSILRFMYNLCSLLHVPVPGFSCHLQDTASPCDWGLVSQIFLREVVDYIPWGAQKP